MRPIQTVDLTTQYASIQKEMDGALLRAVRSGKYINGEEVTAFAQELAEYTGSKYIVPCANGTDALQIALMGLNLKPGDEVIVPAFTYAAAVEVVALLGLLPVVVDVETSTCNINPEKILDAVSPKTKAIIPVHLFGQTCDMGKILKMAKESGLYVIEDNAQSIGAIHTFQDGKQKQSGAMGAIGTLSFFPTKNLGCYGDGGAMMTDNEALAGRLKMITQHGQSSKYRHQIIGCNSRLDTLQAAILSVKLKHLSEYTTARRQVAAYYREHLRDLADKIELPSETPYSSHVYNQFTIRVKHQKRDLLQQHLKERNIPTTVYYPLPIHRQEAFRGIIRMGGNLSSAEELCGSVLSLPIHTELDQEQLEYIVKEVKAFFE